MFTGRVRANQSAFDLTLCAFIEGFAYPDEGSANGLSKLNNHKNPQLQNMKHVAVTENQHKKTRDL